MSGHMRPVATMPGVLIDESEADDSTRALFYAAETPTQADVIRTARWLGVDPLQHAFNLDLNFSELEPGDLAALGYRLPADQQRPAINPDFSAWRAVREGRIINPIPQPDPELRGDGSSAPLFVLGIMAACTAVGMVSGYIWQRWLQAWFASW